MLDSMEDFLDDGSCLKILIESLLALVNTSAGTCCPPALQMIAMLLLQEITSFLRETFRIIPRNKQPAKVFSPVQIYLNPFSQLQVPDGRNSCHIGGGQFYQTHSMVKVLLIV